MSQQQPPKGPPSRRRTPPVGASPPRRQPRPQPPAGPRSSPPRSSPPRSSPPRSSSGPAARRAGTTAEDDDLLLPDEQLEPFRPSKGALILASVITVLAVLFLLNQGGSSGEGDLTFQDEIYITREGDTFTSVSQLLSVDEQALASANGLSPSDALTVGTTLQVPDDPGVTETTPAAIAQVAGTDDIADQLERRAEENGVEPALLKALAWVESGWNNDAVSEAGAIGIGQLLPETATYVSQDLLDDATLSAENADDNIEMSARYLAYLLELNNGDWGAALASYNQGPTSVRRDGWNAAATEYVTKVMALTRAFQADQANG